MLLGYDIGSSSVKASLINAETGCCIASAFSPKKEMPITAKQSGWAEQSPEMWWENLVLATKELLLNRDVHPESIKAIGISYQMHGLVVVDINKEVLRPSIIWCDSRAVDIGNAALKDIGEEKCLSHLLNSPGNFTASKLKWVKENEPELHERIHKIMLPGDYIAMKLTDKITTTIPALSEGMLWDYKENESAAFVMDYFGFNKDIIPDIVSVFSEQGKLADVAANELGLKPGTLVSYRAGDQPNNAFSLNVLKPGEIAATAGTSGVVYGISEEVKYDKFSRVNTFAHVNHTQIEDSLGVLLCVNGTGAMNSWLKRNIGAEEISYEEMNRKASEVAIGADGLFIFPFGNGAERLLSNNDIGCSMQNINFNIHTSAHIYRATQESIAFAFRYGMDIMKEVGIETKIIRAGNANMFLSPLFRQTLADVTGATIELYDTDGSQGAARGAGVGAGLYLSLKDAFKGLKSIATITPNINRQDKVKKVYKEWKSLLIKQ